jgi:hypothetical protein
MENNMAGIVQRSAKLEGALATFIGGKKFSTDAEPLYVCAKKDLLDELDLVLKKIGVSLEADDFCRIAAHTSNSYKGESALTNKYTDAEKIAYIVKFCIEHATCFTSDALIEIKNERADSIYKAKSAVEALLGKSALDEIMKPEMWALNLPELEKFAAALPGLIQYVPPSVATCLADARALDKMNVVEKVRDSASDELRQTIANLTEDNENKDKRIKFLQVLIAARDKQLTPAGDANAGQMLRVSALELGIRQK